MIEELTPEQELLMDEISQKWLDYSGGLTVDFPIVLVIYMCGLMLMLVLLPYLSDYKWKSPFQSK